VYFPKSNCRKRLSYPPAVGGAAQVFGKSGSTTTSHWGRTMPKSRPPAYRRHKASGQARVIVGGKHVYLGPYGSPDSKEAYSRVVASLSQNGGRQPASIAVGDAPTVSALILAYWKFAENYYRRNGAPTKELTGMREALRPLRDLFGSTLASDFGPKSLKVVRQAMIDADLSRGVVNRRINRIKRLIKWAVAEELVPPSNYHALQAVAGLRYGRCDARETEPVKPVPDAWVDATLPYVSAQVSAMIQLQRLTGMRPCEVVLMRGRDLDMTGDLWLYEPAEHKNLWRGHSRQVPLGPQAQAILKPYLKLDLQAYLFSPAEAEAARNEARKANRKSPMTPSQAKRKPKKRPLRPKQDRYDVASYRRAITYGIKKANKAGKEVPHWNPYRLRHSYATDVRKRFGIEAAQVSLGHARADVTQVYAERNLELARKVAQECG